MPLSQDAFPYVDPADGKTKIWDGGQAYDVDPNGQAITPNGPEVPWWGAPTPTQSPMPKLQVQTPTLPALDIQPGLTAQQWQAQYTLNLAAEKRLREILETVDQPKARMAIDQAIQEIRQSLYQNQVAARESQAEMTGNIPQWLPQPPRFEQGAWKGYQPGGLVAHPGGTIGQTPGAPMSDDMAAQAIWNARPDIQQLYRSEHPDWPPAQAVADWWQYAPHEGASTMGDYARLKGYLAA